MEIFGVLILLTICGVVIYYLDLFEMITNGVKTAWNSLKEKIEDSIVAKENAKKEKRLTATAEQKKRKTEAKNRTQVWKDIRTLSRKQFFEQLDESVNVGPNVTVSKSGGRHVTDVGKLLSSPEVQRQLKAVHNLFMGETLRALKYGKKPPHQVGKGTYTLKTLKRDWNDEWQSVADEIGIRYYDLFPKKARVGSPGISADAYFAKPAPPPNPPKPPPPPNEILDMGSFKQDMSEFKAEMKKFKSEMKKLRKVKSYTGSTGPR